MTARQLFIEIEDKLRESLALCDMVASAAVSEVCELDGESVSRVMAIAISDLRGIVEFCEGKADEEGRQSIKEKQMYEAIRDHDPEWIMTFAELIRLYEEATPEHKKIVLEMLRQRN